MTWVVDASLATKLLVVEQDSDRAVRFFSRSDELHAPDLLLIEVGGAIVRAVNKREASQEEGLEGIARLAAFVAPAVQLHRVTPDLSAAGARLAIALGHPLKDCIYLALADQLGCALATCDAKFRDRVADPARVRLLSEIA